VNIFGKLSSLNLKTKIILMVLLLFLGSIWMLTFLNSKYLEQDMIAQIEVQQFSIASYIADSVESQVKLRFESLATIASFITPELISNPGKLRESLRQRLLIRTLFRNGVTVISKEGKGIADYPVVPGRSTASYREFEYFRDVIATLKPAIGKPQIGRFTHRPFIAFAVPILNRSGKLMGVLTASVSLSDPSLLGTIETSSYQGFSDRLILVSRKYRMISTGSDPSRIMTPSVKAGTNPVLAKFMAGFEGSIITVNPRGIRMLLTAKQIPTPGWFIRVGAPTEIVFAPIKRMKIRAYSLALGLSMLSSLLLWLVIRQALRPLSMASKLIQDITDKRLPFQKLPVTRDDEIGQLLTSFNTHLDYRRQAEEEKGSLLERLQRAEKMEALGQLAGGVAHDLNNVLGVLTGYSELLQEQIPEGDRAKIYVDKILQSTEKGAAIIQDLLTLARRGVVVSAVINLKTIVSDFLKSPVFEKLKDHHSSVTFLAECDENLLNIKGSPVHLEKMLLNLVSNAAEAISGKGEVTIRTENRYLDTPLRGYDEIKSGEYVVLIISDTGTGIRAENIDKIFEPFYTKKTMGRSGTGLGLAIVWGTVKDHKGYIDIQTEVGKGTTFTLYFPVTREELIAEQQKVPIELYMGKGESVLVVDDIAEQRDVATVLLTRLGYQVTAVSSGEAAVEYLKNNRADIMVLDMIMAPGIDGLETYSWVLKINPNQKAIIVSGFSETDRVKEAQNLGAGAYIRKPYLMEKVGITIQNELNRK